MANEIQPQNRLAPKAPKKEFSQFLSQDNIKKAIISTLGDKTQSFTTTIISAVQANPMLQECSHMSILSAALIGTSLNLSPSPQLGQFFLVPYKKKEKKNGEWTERLEAQFIIGYKGLINLAIRSGVYKTIGVVKVKDGEFKGYNLLGDKYIISCPQTVEYYSQRERLPNIGYYAFFEQKNGFEKSVFATKEQIMKHAEEYSSFDPALYEKFLKGNVPTEQKGTVKGSWYPRFDTMAEKTVLIKLLKRWGNLSPEMEKAIEADEKIIDLDGNFESVSMPDHDVEEPQEVEIETEKEEQQIKKMEI